ncbi:hypothetical protein [Actinoplanes sp. NPDC049118]|uniref:hypothetical protein n=1 Tax=Actinoplanes sp. NPDC049118 TaxID=3155769 RepID=UPI0033C81E2F
MIAGDGPAPRLVLALAQRLPDTSLTAALAAGGREHFGWGVDRHLIADLYDALNQNTRATGNWAKGKAPALPAWPRPKATASRAEQQKPVTVADLYTRLTRR